MKKFAFVIMILFAVVMSLPVSAVNSVIDAENSEHRYTKKTLPHVTRGDIAGLTM